MEAEVLSVSSSSDARAEGTRATTVLLFTPDCFVPADAECGRLRSSPLQPEQMSLAKQPCCTRPCGPCSYSEINYSMSITANQKFPQSFCHHSLWAGGNGAMMCFSGNVASIRSQSKADLCVLEAERVHTCRCASAVSFAGGGCVCSWWQLWFVPRSVLYLL